MKNQQQQKEGLNVREAAVYAGLSVPTLLKYLPEIAHKKAGRRTIIAKSALDEWMRGSV